MARITSCSRVVIGFRNGCKGRKYELFTTYVYIECIKLGEKELGYFFKMENLLYGKKGKYLHVVTEKL